MDENLNTNEPEQTKELVKRTVTAHGRTMTLVGDEIKVGMPAPDFKVIDNEMLPMKFIRTYKNRISLITSVPSLDTPVCDMETRRFNKEAESFSQDLNILAISMDLPFAQKRWCGAAGINRLKTYSDYLKADFGKSYGVLIKELRLLARAVFIVDKDGIVKYAQIVPETGNEPNYQEVLTALKSVV
ncbi:MAG: thiol peroxidase [Elusimicrobia bacterium]|nr:thiol peroxidase [Elusimicrobiota bacterium]